MCEFTIPPLGEDENKIASNSRSREFYQIMEATLLGHINDLIRFAVTTGQGNILYKIEKQYLHLAEKIKEDMIRNFIYELNSKIENQGYSLENFVLRWELITDFRYQIKLTLKYRRF